MFLSTCWLKRLHACGVGAAAALHQAATVHDNHRSVPDRSVLVGRSGVLYAAWRGQRSHAAGAGCATGRGRGGRRGLGMAVDIARGDQEDGRLLLGMPHED